MPISHTAVWFEHLDKRVATFHVLAGYKYGFWPVNIIFVICWGSCKRFVNEIVCMKLLGDYSFFNFCSSVLRMFNASSVAPCSTLCMSTLCGSLEVWVTTPCRRRPKGGSTSLKPAENHYCESVCVLILLLLFLTHWSAICFLSDSDYYDDNKLRMTSLIDPSWWLFCVVRLFKGIRIACFHIWSRWPAALQSFCASTKDMNWCGKLRNVFFVYSPGDTHLADSSRMYTLNKNSISLRPVMYIITLMRIFHKASKILDGRHLARLPEIYKLCSSFGNNFIFGKRSLT